MPSETQEISKADVGTVPAEPAEQISSQVTRAIPNIICEVRPGESVGIGEETHNEGDRFEIEGPSAIALVQAGHVTIVGSVAPE
jgi:hypothetical protein